MKPDLPIIGERDKDILSASWALFKAEALEIDANMKAINDVIKIAELRKSCGVPTEATCTINIRRPPRYLNTLKE